MKTDMNEMDAWKWLNQVQNLKYQVVEEAAQREKSSYDKPI